MTKLTAAIFAISLASTISMSAATYPWLTFTMKDSSEVSVAADNLVMNYTDGNLILSSEKVNETLAVSDIASMRFTSEASAVESVAAATGATHYYSISGIHMGVYDSLDSAREALPSGTYIGNAAGKTFKVIF